MKAAIVVGKDVHGHRPLPNRTADSEELLALAEAKGVRHVAGLQRCMEPGSRYARDLVKHGYVGDVRAVRIAVDIDLLGLVRPAAIEWTIDADNVAILCVNRTGVS
ncbi:hypothetical protein ACFVGN_42965 [Streptomyces sp. NPDC057757]|uniref:hypothetical protein n=1 Tax=Streptomyces sp. NPDC057757 TaxID=3346241 RepID=UPI0036A192B9